jgi:hypothetical protein
MPRSISEIERRIEEVTRPGFRGRLLARGLARNLIWSEGKVPDGSALTNPLLSSDLLSYGLAVMQLALELRTLDRSNPNALEAFARAGEAIESVVKNGVPDFNERGFYTVIAAAAYHLGHYSARAFSLLPSSFEGNNLSPAEYALTLLIRRDLTALRSVLVQLSGSGGFDAVLAERLRSVDQEAQLDESIFEVLNIFYHEALALFDYAIESGDPSGTADALKVLDEGILSSSEYCSVPFWWIFTITRHLLDDLWDQSLHERLPHSPDNSSGTRWSELRHLFIAKLLKYSRAEIDLWPSQLAAAARAIDVTDDLVAALPTSAGKTRIAEICILKALANRTRVVFITPLRALSAQTERGLRQTFGPLGFSVSSLYGSSGTTGDDIDSLRNRDIVVSTPEKLDFALRNNPEILDDVGLIVFDEAHTIGAGEREVRYEVLVQRVLRRPDSDTRRIVCLSAILPQGEQIEDFVGWIRQDQPGDAVTVNWRPTRQCFGEITWNTRKQSAKLDFRVNGADEDAPFVDPFIKSLLPRGKQTKPLPRDRRDLSLMSTWRLVEDGKTVLLYCPERRSVMPLATLALDLVRRGYLKSLLAIDIAVLNDAINIGREWLGEDHPAVQCLKIGIAVHHGTLPRPFLRAIERLLKDQLLKVTIASPTLAQGLNLSATTVLFSSLKRGRDFVPGEEFANVAGRAGRAFVDVEGQVICTVWEREHLMQWERLLKDAKERNLKSGLLRLILDFCGRLAVKKGYSLNQVLEYVTGNANPWLPPAAGQINTEKERTEQESFEKKWESDLATLDSALLSLVQHDVPVEELAGAMDVALRSSLWERSLLRESDARKALSLAVLRKRGDFIWRNSSPAQRKGYFYAGVSFTTGRYLDENATELERLLRVADAGFASGEIDQAEGALVAFAQIIFEIEPFRPKEMIDGWENILLGWVAGDSMSDLAGGKDAEVIEFIEGALVYRLVWGMEAVRVRKKAADDMDEWEDAGRAALAVETGTSSLCAALLIQSGLPSRVAAMKVVTDYPPNFTDIRGMRQWIHSENVTEREFDENWPTPETAWLWLEFVEGLKSAQSARWSIQTFEANVAWQGASPAQGTAVRVLFNPAAQNMRVFSTALEPLGVLPYKWQKEPTGIIMAKAGISAATLPIVYLGPNDLFSTPN